MANKKFINATNKIFQEEQKFRYCCAPIKHGTQCNGNIIKAHSISICLGLKNIKDMNNEVYSIRNHGNIHSLYKAQGVFSEQKINIKSASTARMFCQTHDKEIFQPIEDQDFIINKKNCFLLAYRSVCLEFFKTNKKISVPQLKQYDISILKNKLDNFLIHEEFDQLNHYIFEVKCNNLLTSSIYTPCVNFKNKIIQDAESKNALIPVIVNSIRINSTGYIIFSFEKEHTNFIEEDYLKKLISLPIFKQSQVLTNIFFKIFENIFWNIAWWENLDKKRKLELFNYMQPLQTTTKPCSFDDMEEIMNRNNNRFAKILTSEDTPGFYVQKGYYLK